MLEMIFIVLGGLFTAMVFLGMSLSNKKTLFTGLFCYSFLPILGESLGWIIDKQLFHLLFIALFICQMIISSIRFQTQNEIESMKPGLMLRIVSICFVINAISSIMILFFPITINIVYGFYHLLICIVLLPIIIGQLLKVFK